MEVKIKDKSFNKLDPSTKKSVQEGIKKLNERASYYFEQNIPIWNVKNDDILLHDILLGKYFTYKCCVGRQQLRILYTVEGENLVILAYSFKENNSKKYLNEFAEIVKKLN